MKILSWVVFGALGFGIMCFGYFGRDRPDPRATWAHGLIVIGPPPPAGQALPGGATPVRLRLLPGSERDRGDPRGIDLAMAKSRTCASGPARAQVDRRTLSRNRNRSSVARVGPFACGKVNGGTRRTRRGASRDSGKRQHHFQRGRPAQAGPRCVRGKLPDTRPGRRRRRQNFDAFGRSRSPQRDVDSSDGRADARPESARRACCRFSGDAAFHRRRARTTRCESFLYLHRRPGRDAHRRFRGTDFAVQSSRGSIAWSQEAIRQPDIEPDGAELVERKPWPGWLAAPLVELQRRPRLVWGVHIYYFGLVILGLDAGPCDPGSVQRRCSSPASAMPLSAESGTPSRRRARHTQPATSCVQRR